MRENTEFGGYLASEVLGLPCASVAVDGGKAHQLAQPLAAPLDRQRRTLGCRRILPADQPVAPRRRPTRLADRGPAPYRFAAFGTILPVLNAYDAVHAIVAGLGEVDCTAVVAVGSEKVPDTAGEANVRIVASVPQPLMLECSDLFINHGGFNRVREALRLGVPMVIVPWLTDSHRNAERCAELGWLRWCRSMCSWRQDCATLVLRCSAIPATGGGLGPCSGRRSRCPACRTCALAGALARPSLAIWVWTRRQPCQWGKDKQKRCDLRLVGAGLVVTRDDGIPLDWFGSRLAVG